MRIKWYKKDGKWEKIKITDKEEVELKEKFIREYTRAFRKIMDEVKQENLDHDQKFQLGIEIFKKLVSPAHFKMQEILEKRKEEILGEVEEEKEEKPDEGFY